MKEETVMAMNLKNELQAVSKELKVLTKKVEKIAGTIGKVEKAKPAKKAPAKKLAVQKTGEPSAIESVMGVIKRSRKLVDIATLKERTGFQGQKLHNIVYLLKKQGKIKSAGKGLYARA